MKTKFREYEIPDKNNRVVDDVNNLIETIEKIDEDLVSLENSLDPIVETVSNLDARSVGISSESGVEAEIKKVIPNGFVVMNDDGSGFAMLQGGGNEGGFRGDILVKSSKKDMDWGASFSMACDGLVCVAGKSSVDSNESLIISDNDLVIPRYPRAGVVEKMITNDLIFCDANGGVILSDSIENREKIVPKASATNFGIVKIGDRVDVENGIISIKNSVASKTDTGIVKIGDGIDVENGIISSSEIQKATFQNFGSIKLGSNLAIDENGELIMNEIDPLNDCLIYGAGKIKVCTNGIIDLEEKIVNYRCFVNEDIAISFNCLFEQIADVSFNLELVSYVSHVVSFADMVSDFVTPIVISGGTTVIKVTRLLGMTKYSAVVSNLNAPTPIVLCTQTGDSISDVGFICCNGSNRLNGYFLGTLDSDIYFSANPREVYFDFFKSVIVDNVYFNARHGDVKLSIFSLFGSNDKKNWIPLINKENSIIEQNTPAEFKGSFKFFKLVFSNENPCRGILLNGAFVNNDDSQLIRLTPKMTADLQGGVRLSCSTPTVTSLKVLTDTSEDYTDVPCPADVGCFIQYEFTEATIVKLIEIASRYTNNDCSPIEYDFVASNDGETWETLLNRCYTRGFYQFEERFHYIQNETAYKYYRLIVKKIGRGETLALTKFRLFGFEVGIDIINYPIPALSSAFQNGYEVSASAQADGEFAWRAFDKNDETQWAASNPVNSWIKIKLPAAQAFNCVRIRRRESWWVQSPTSMIIQGSNDGETWIDLHSTAETDWASKLFILLKWENETSYLYYRLFVKSVVEGDNVGLNSLEFGIYYKEYKTYLEKYDYIVPIIQSNNTGTDATGTYVLTFSSEHSEEAWKWYHLFSRNINFKGEFFSGQMNGWIQIECPVAKVVNILQIGARNDSSCGGAPRTYLLYGSQNGASWTQLFFIANSATFLQGELRAHEIENETAYKYYRINVSNSAESYLSFSRLDFMYKGLFIE